MSAPSDQLLSPSMPSAARRLRLDPFVIVVLGVFAIPLALSLSLNSWGALTEASALRMAFATVAGQTIAILSAVAAVIVAVMTRQSRPRVALTVWFAIAVLFTAIALMAGAGVTLLDRLDLIAEVDLLNR